MNQTTRYVFACSLVAALGGLLFGFDTAVISGAEGTLQELWELSGFVHGFTVASALIGTIIGAIVIGKPADIYGRRTMLFTIAALFLLSAIGSALAWDWYSFVVFRFIGGLAIGGASVVSPMYIAEIAPARLRGRLVAITQFNIVLGILLAFLSNYIIATLDLGAIEWRWMFGVEAFPAAIFLGLLLFVPRSPRWLVAQERFDEARDVLDRIGTDTDSVDSELEAIRQSLSFEHHALREPFFQRKYAVPIMLAIAIAAFNQLSGINAVLYYAPRLFSMTGAEGDVALLSSVVLGLVNLIFTMAALSVIDYFGRRALMLVGSIGYILSLGTVAFAFYAYGDAFAALANGNGAAQEAAAEAGIGGTVVLVGLIVFIASHAFGQGAVIWVFISEIFPNRVRARGQALGSFTHWFMAAAISWTFPFLAEIGGGHIFAFYCAMMVLQLLWVLFIMPETRNVPLEKIQQKLGIRDTAASADAGTSARGS